jgi:ribonuclease E
LVVATGTQQVGDIYMGVVENVIQGIDAAFVNIGDAERNGFIHVTDLGPLRLRKTAGAITELLVPQQKVLVQVMKEPTGNKGPRLTGNITMPGRYLVLMPYGRGVNLSRRIRNEDERSRLRALAVLIKPPGMALLVRTEAEGKAEEAIMEDLEFLQKQWESIQQQALSSRPPALLNRDDDFIQRVLRDMFSAEVNRIVTDSPSGLKRVKEQLRNWSGGQAPEGVLIDCHREPQSILDYFRINAAIREALKPRVELPSGGYIIIEPTEALTVVDVNSGSFTRSATARETVLWTNSESATEIARQLRLRNIGGVIIVDFIDMDSRRDQLKLLEHFTKALRADKARPQIAQLSELGLVELTRKRQGKNLYELFGQPCPTCGGLGHLVHLPGTAETVALEAPPSATPVLTPRTVEMPASQALPRQPLEGALEEEDGELDLLHHPSYQEQNVAPSRRRRRRAELPAKEEPSEQKLVAETVPETPESEPRKERFPRPLRREREEVPVEAVTVEMTPLEQDIYALMGVSPVVRLDREFKDPKSAIVSVKLPGEADVARPASAPPQEPESESAEPEELAEATTPTAVTALTPESSSESNQLPESLNGDTEPADSPIRRRRRRSSATAE